MDRNSKYIKDILKHIESKSRKSKIEAEFFDHIDEKEKFFEEIGYDSSSSEDKTIECMGDAQIIGEQLNEVSYKSHNKTVAAAILNVITVFNFFTALAFGWIIFASSLINYEYISLWSIIILFAINLLVGIFRKRLLNLTTSLIMLLWGIFIAFFKDDWYQGVFHVLINGIIHPFKNSYVFDIYNPNYRLITFLKNNNAEHIFYIAVAILIVIILTAMIISIKTKKLCNTKSDLYVFKGLKIFAIILTVSAIAVTFPNSLVIREKVYNQAKEELTYINEKIINNLDLLFECDYKNPDDFNKYIYTIFSTDEITIVGEEGESYKYRSKSDNIEIRLYYDLDYHCYNLLVNYNEDLFSDIDFYFVLNNDEYIYQMEDYFNGSKTSVKDAPLCANLSIELNEKKPCISLTYENGDVCHLYRLTFKYADGEFIKDDYINSDLL